MDDEVIPVETEKPPKERVKLTHSTWAKTALSCCCIFSLVLSCLRRLLYLRRLRGHGLLFSLLDNIDFGWQEQLCL